MAVDTTQTIVEARDGYNLASRQYVPEESPDAAVLINSAMATPQQFYSTFADWLAKHGYYVATFDYRGIGDSRPDGIRTVDATINDWAHRDIGGMIEFLNDRHPSVDLFVVGHSLGGQVMGLLGNRYSIDATATFSAQSGYWKLQHPKERWRLFLASYLIFPGLTHTFGYLPWSHLFGGEDIPGQVALQWARWCRHPEYLLSDGSVDNREGYARFESPILGYSFEDDYWGWKDSVDWMMKQYTSSNVTRYHVKPEDYKVETIGHFGFFQEGMERAWEDLMERLESV